MTKDRIYVYVQGVGIQIVRWISRQMDTYINRQIIDRQIDRQIDSKMDKQIDQNPRCK